MSTLALGSWVSYAASLACKPGWVSLPILLLLLDLWPLRRTHLGWRRLLWEKGPFFLLAAAAALLTLITTVNPSELHGDRISWELLPLGARLANLVVVYPQYLLKTLLPYDLAAFYPHPQDTLPTATVLLSALALLGLTGSALILWRRLPLWGVGWFWFVVALLPVSGLAQAGTQAMADRFTYLPHIGLFLALAGVLPTWERPLGSPARVTAALAGVGMVLFSILCWQQVGYWRDSGTLWRHTLRVTENNLLVHYLLGKHLLDQGEHEAAVEQFAAALKLAPRAPFAIHYKLARALLALNRLPEARVAITEVLAGAPDEPPLLLEMGQRFMTTQTVDLANGFFEKALRSPSGLTPMQQARAHFLLAIGLASVDGLPAAMSHFRAAISEPGPEKPQQCAILNAMLNGNPATVAAHPAQAAELRAYCF
ncbi:MAG: tetratricopeptide repeat protein [Magnetococcales bacterium]|nr:tetratricopeptide repeat protein [Magnetococcales bacterium]